jgi:hypothetical protein
VAVGREVRISGAILAAEVTAEEPAQYVNRSDNQP